jgi:hypothetical protein
MTLIEDFQPLIDWCTQPHPQDHPRLQRVARALLQKWRAGEGSGWGIPAGEWGGPLIYWPRSVRQILGGFSGALPRVGYPGQEAHVWLTLAEDDAWIGVQGPDVGEEWREDVHFFEYTVNGEKPEDTYLCLDDL